MAKAKAKTAQKPRAKKTKGTSKPVVITMLLDESGSMGVMQKSTIEGFNEYVGALKADPTMENCYFSAIKFDSRGVRKLQVGAKIKDAVKLNLDNYQPTGSTPLNDAVAKTILATDEIVKEQGAERVILVVQTDGAENCSTEYSKTQVKQMVEERQGKGWSLIFIGAGIDAFGESSQYGFSAVNTMSYATNDAAVGATFRATAASNSRYTRAASAVRGQSLASFSATERDASGEAGVLGKFVAGGAAAQKAVNEAIKKAAEDPYSLKETK